MHRKMFDCEVCIYFFVINIIYYLYTKNLFMNEWATVHRKMFGCKVCTYYFVAYLIVFCSHE